MLTIRRIAAGAGLICTLGAFASCARPDPVEHVHVSLHAGELYQRATPSGDEEGARILTQALHYATSEIHRNAVTGVVNYFYQPAPAFVGSDEVTLELLRGSDGATASTPHLLRIHFNIH